MENELFGLREEYVDSDRESSENVSENEEMEEDDDDHTEIRADEAIEIPDHIDTPASVPKPKKVVKNPLPKLDVIRLMGPRGIGAIQKPFKNVKFKGKAHEKEDLDLLLKHLEHWAHRLFPKLPFDDVLEQIEKLGNKKQAQNLIKRIRYDTFEEISSDIINDENIPEPQDPFDELLNKASRGNIENLIPKIPTAPVPITKRAHPMTEELRQELLLKKMEAEEKRRMRAVLHQSQSLLDDRPDDLADLSIEDNNLPCVVQTQLHVSDSLKVDSQDSSLINNNEDCSSVTAKDNALMAVDDALGMLNE